MNTVRLIAAFILSVTFTDGRTYMTTSMTACRNIEIELVIEFIEPGRPLPGTWEEFPMVRRISVDPSIGNLETMRWTNALAIVPGAPVVVPAEGIKRLRAGKRLFAISRERGEWFDPVTKEGSSGRCAIFVDQDGKLATSNWVPESEAQLILKGIPDFDPLEQPVAFEKLEELEREKEARDKQSEEFLKKRYREEKKKVVRDLFFPANGTEDQNFPWKHLPIFGLLMLALVAWLLVKVIRGKPQA